MMFVLLRKTNLGCISKLAVQAKGFQIHEF